MMRTSVFCVAVAVAMTGCASYPDKPPRTASCMETQAYCVQVCQIDFKNTDLSNSLGLILGALTGPKTPKSVKGTDRDPVMSAGREASQKNKDDLAACKESCDTAQQQCMDRRR